MNPLRSLFGGPPREKRVGSRLLGLIGGVSPESTVIYYRLMNERARERFGGQHSVNALLWTLDYGVMIKLYEAGDWDAFRAEVAAGGRALKAAGADLLVITSNTTHLAAEALAEATGLEVFHMLDVLAEEMRAAGVKKPLLLGTPVVMTGPFYLSSLAARYDGEVATPDEADRAETGRIILDELVEGVVSDASRERYKAMIAKAKADGADGVILGCTELCMILSQEDTDLPVFDTTALHARAAFDAAHG